MSFPSGKPFKWTIESKAKEDLRVAERDRQFRIRQENIRIEQQYKDQDNRDGSMLRQIVLYNTISIVDSDQYLRSLPTNVKQKDRKFRLMSMLRDHEIWYRLLGSGIALNYDHLKGWWASIIRWNDRNIGMAPCLVNLINIINAWNLPVGSLLIGLCRIATKKCIPNYYTKEQTIEHPLMLYVIRQILDTATNNKNKPNFEELKIAYDYALQWAHHEKKYIVKLPLVLERIAMKYEHYDISSFENKAEQAKHHYHERHKANDQQEFAFDQKWELKRKEETSRLMQIQNENQHFLVDMFENSKSDNLEKNVLLMPEVTSERALRSTIEPTLRVLTNVQAIRDYHDRLERDD